MIFCQITVFLVVAVFAKHNEASQYESSMPPSPQYNKQPYNPQPYAPPGQQYGTPYKQSYQDTYAVPAKYDYKYAVNDYYGNQHSKHEERDGYTSKGEYTVLLPNGLLQRTKYVADEYGYRADVTYEGGAPGSYGQPGAAYSPPAKEYTASYASKPAYESPKPAYEAPKAPYYAPKPISYTPPAYRKPY